MPLPTSRAQLMRCIDSGLEAAVMKDWYTVKGLIDTWWMDYKEWERNDTFGAAFHDSRMTSRTWSGAIDQVEVMKPPANRIKDTKGQHGQRQPELVQQFDSFEYQRSVGMASLAQRTTPSNFYLFPDGGSRRTELGLHDMSATLLNPQKAISDQAHSKHDGTIFSFMPLSDPLDQAVFQALNRTAKDLRVEKPEFYDRVREIRSKMTRIKLAAEHDMGTGFTATQRQDGPGFKIRYGLGHTTKVADEAKAKMGVAQVKVGVVVTEQILKARRDAALNFRSIVERLVFDHTEIVIAYRQHAGAFPLFARFNEARKQFDFVTVFGNAIVPTNRAPIADKPPR